MNRKQIVQQLGMGVAALFLLFASQTVNTGAAFAGPGATGGQGGVSQPPAEGPKLIKRANLDMGWNLDAGIRYDVGWNLSLKPAINLQITDPFEGTGLKADQTVNTPPSRVLLTEGIFSQYGFTAKPQFQLLTDKEWFLEKPPTMGLLGHWDDPIANGAFNILDEWGSTLEVGAFIGNGLKSIPFLFGSGLSRGPGFYDAMADYTLDILDEYEFYEDDSVFSPKDAGNAVYAAVIAAGGSPEEAFRQAKRAAEDWGRSGFFLQTRIHLPRFNLSDDLATLQGRDLKLSPAISGFAINPGAFSDFGLNAPWSLDAVYAEQNRVLQSYDAVAPNDPLYKKSGGFSKVSTGIKKSIGFLLRIGDVGGGTAEDAQTDDQWGLHAVGFTPKGSDKSAWDIYDGIEKNVVVAVIDSGLDLEHPDRPKYIWKNEGEIPDNGLDDDGNGYVDDIHGWNFVSENNNIDDDYGHGTFVTGIIAAATDNGEGIAGINPGARIMVLKASNGEGSARDLAIYRALRYAVDNGARVINISLGNRGKSRLVQIGINYAHAMGRIVVVAAGNEGGNIAEFTPQGSRQVISVGATNIDGTRRSNSNKGLSLSLVAPGESIYSLTATHGKRDGRIAPILAGKYHRLNGTSFAAPFVTGAASLLWARNPTLTNTQVEDMLLSSTAEIGKPGWNPDTGMGVLSAHGAMVQSPKTAFAPRITEIHINRNRRTVESVDVYGIVRGPVQSCTLEVGRGRNPEKNEWQRVFGPSKQTVDSGHIARIPGMFFSDGSQWTIRLTAAGPNGEIRVQQVLVTKES